MSTLLAKVLADFSTSLATAIVVGGTTATLQSATDDDGIALVAGRYFFTIDGENASKEHFSCDLSGTALTNLKSVSRQGVETAGAVRAHRIGSTVSLTDFAHLFFMNNLLSGGTTFNASVPLGYDGTASITTANQFATKAYVDSVAVSGAPNASTTVKGIVEEATQAEVISKSVTGGTGAELYVNPSTLASTLLSDYKADTGAADAAVITPVPAITAYTTGQRFTFKVIATNTTTTPTLNVNGFGAKTIVKNGSSALIAGDLITGQIVEVEYDGTNMQLMSPVATNPIGNYQAFTGSGTWTKPSNLTGNELVLVKMWGAGGGGGTQAAGSNMNGGGGGGGGYAERTFKLSDLGATVTVTIGAGGAISTVGGNTTFGSLVTAYGGGGGASVSGITPNTGGAGGGGGGVAGAGGTGTQGAPGTAGAAGASFAGTDSVYGGGAGSNTVAGTPGGSVYGGGGGTGADDNAVAGKAGGNSLYGGGGGARGGNGGTAPGGTSTYGGAGGAGGLGAAGSPGVAPGGGGGSAGSGGGGGTLLGGVGARGEVRVWIYQ